MALTITLQVRRATVVQGFGTDRISLELEAPTTFPAMDYPTYLTTEAQRGYGVQWCQEVLGIESPEVINARTPEEKR